MSDVTAYESGMELLITVVVAAEDEATARDACAGVVELLDGRVVRTTDCSDEEPGCRSVTISRKTADPSTGNPSATLARAVRNTLHTLGSGFTGSRVSCEPPSAWTVVDAPELVGELVPGGERMLLEAWQSGSTAPNTGTGAPDTSDRSPRQGNRRPG
ncbi:hypothetical protein SAMN04487904_102246 [Actinopolyspora lacussalsi subsp. righensis]|uniref:Uncharacterized protein n=1 Tax=Actinopolyspora righensis TaxID=995060 RepID=A0A1I6Y725_9ACTN|nr:hypothetical protein SAMN04487904_102246 [Actinopolyspora righensis]